MNFEFDFFGMDRLFSLPLEDHEQPTSDLADWIMVPLLNHRKSWLLLQLDRRQWQESHGDESAALELANVLAARKLAECDGLALGTPSWLSPLQLRQVQAWVQNAVDSGEGRWAQSSLPRFYWYLVADHRPGGHSGELGC
ncbi:MAG: hypothetical protein ACK5QT_10355 [Oligoflexia bacterium]|jgi:hypothetical protein